MKPYRTLFLPLIISLQLCSCSSTKGLGTTETSEGASIQRFSPLGSISEPVLFKASIGIYKDHYSGLFLIKRMPEESSIRVLFLSELGLSLMDLEYREDEFEVVNVQEFLNRPALLKTLQNDFRTLLLDLSTIDAYSVTEVENETGEMLTFKHRSQKYSYFCNENMGTYRIKRKKGMFKRVDIGLERGEDLNIGIAHKGIKLHIDLHQLKQFGDDAN